MKFFSTESKFFKFISTLWDVMKLNFCWFICSLPIITIGASTLAAYTITLKIIEDQEGYIIRPFFKAFKANFKQGMVVGPITLLFVAAVYVDFKLSYMTPFLVLGVLSAFLFTIAMIYTYPLLARYENKIFQTIKNSMRISMRYFGKTIFLVVLLVVEYLVFRLTYITMVLGILVGPVTMMMTVSGIAMYFFKEIEHEGGVVVRKTEEDLYNEEIEKEAERLSSSDFDKRQ